MTEETARRHTPVDYDDDGVPCCPVSRPCSVHGESELRQAKEFVDHYGVGPEKVGPQKDLTVAEAEEAVRRFMRGEDS